MVQKFLKAQHWQLFVLTFGIPMVFQFIVMGSIIANITTRAEQHTDPMDFFNYMKFFPIMMALLVSIFFGWFWSVVTGLQTNLSDELKIKLTRFKVFFFVPIIYLLFILTYMVIVFNGFMSNQSDPDIGVVAIVMAVVFPLHLFSMFCIFHTIYYVAKTVKTVELGRKVTFSDFAGEFFLIWFFPIGIWIIQPKINKMVE